MEILSENQLKYLNNVYLDEDRMKQILINLVSNSIKFTQEYGKISIIV